MTQEIIRKYQLEPLSVLGGHACPIYRSDNVMKDGERPIGSAIYYYLNSDDFLGWHRADYDEMWNFYKGSDITIHYFDESGDLQCVCLSNSKAKEDAVLNYVVPAGTWFSAEVATENSYALVGCVCLPAFSEEGLEVAKKEALTKLHPEHADIICRLTRE